MDKSWMYDAPRSSSQFVSGVQIFLNFAFQNSNQNGKILCPCVNCCNLLYLPRADVFDHLVCSGFVSGYSRWVYHGEGYTTSIGVSSMVDEVREEIFNHDMHGLLNDIFQQERNVESSLDFGRSEVQMGDTLNDARVVTNGRPRIFDLLKDAEEEIYPKSKYSKLSCLVHLFHLKCLNGWSNKSFTMLLEFLRDLLPEGNLLPKTAQQVKRNLADLGLGYEKIHACPNGCVLFWEDKARDEICSVCGASRWKVLSDDSIGVNQRKKKAEKILRWFPLKPRLQRLFTSSKMAKLMKWHDTEREKDGKLRHPADALAWREFDNRYPEFASDPRNVRLALASDGFNPFKTMNVTYSIWPVFLIPYNLPPWLVMKQPNLILSLIIPSPRGPGNKIDVYMQPLVKELKELWEVGIETFDASTNQTFQLKAALHSTISDFPGYANLSGWSTKGELACPLCAFNTNSKWLHHGRKWCYMSHRRWLQTNHPWRKDIRSFDGDKELRNSPFSLDGTEILQQLDGIDFLDEVGDRGAWKKKSIFFMLPYWKYLMIRHNLDVMHIEKNVCDNIVGTLMGQEGKSKDNLKVRLDLQKMGIRKELHPTKRPRSNSMFLPRACYQMSRAEIEVFLKTLKFLKPPDEYSSNISRCVQLKERKLIGLKSYDCHMLMQEYLPIALRGTLPNHVSSVIIDLCDFFKRICLKDLTESDLQLLESRIAIILCKMERIFPPSFFTVMVHLMIHLVTEIRLGGPVTYRWMYPIERDLLTLKSYVHNRAYPEGSIAEGYLAQESLTFCSHYLSGVETLFSRPVRNDDESDQNEIEEGNLLCPGRPLGHKLNSQGWSKKRKFKNFVLDDQSLAQAHRYVLFNVDAISPFREEHKKLIKTQNRSRRVSEYEIDRVHCQRFSGWFQKMVERLQEQGDERVTEEIKWLARGPNQCVKRYSGYLVKGYRFHTKDHEKFLKTQNSGVVVSVKDVSYASSRDSRPMEGVINYYGSLKDIIEVNYSAKIRVVLFKCDWIDINRGCKKDEFGVTLVNFSCLSHKGTNVLDDPFVFASQVDKVFYAQDAKSEEWVVVRHVKLRDAFNIGSVTDQASEIFDVPELHRTTNDGVDGVDVTARMEVDDIEEETDESD